MLTKVAIVDKDEKYLENFKNYMSDKNIKCYSYITIKDYIADKELYDFDVILINDDYKTKEKKGNNVIILLNEQTLSDEEDINSKYYFKYQNMNNLLKQIYEIINQSYIKDDDINDNIQSVDKNHTPSITYPIKNIVIYNASSLYVDGFMNKLIDDIMPGTKKLIWNYEMFSNEVSDDGMDMAMALGSNNILNNDSFLNKLKKVNDDTFTFYPLTNPYDFNELSQEDYVDINNKLNALDFKCNISILKGNVNSFINDVINKADTFILLYTKYDEIKKDRVKNYFSYIKKKNNNSIKDKIIELKLTHSKKDYMLLNNIRGMIC